MSMTDLYREQVLTHARDPHHFRAMPEATVRVPGQNPLCGDKLELFVTVDGDRVSDVSFQGSGCAISMASASMLSECLSGASRETARELADAMQDMLADAAGSPVTGLLADTPLAALAGVRRHPSRIKCAALAWRALVAALDGDTSPVTTEQET